MCRIIRERLVLYPMLEEIKIITSRRAYEFHSDDLRLSALCIKPVQEQIQNLFQFQSGILGIPMPTFGEVPATYPPGFVFNMGVLLTLDEQLVPIRFLHFEQRRIVIDVAGTSSALTPIFERLQQFLSGLRAPDGSPVIGEPERVLDYSIITAKFPFSLEAMLAPPFRKLLERVTDAKGSSKDLAMGSTFVTQMHPVGQEIAKVASPEDSAAFTFAQRVGTRPEERIYLSCAPLDSEAHLSYLNELEEALR